jgi:glycosyltransferase involved in cell wall biosynthesis
VPRSMRILLVVDSLDIGGAEQHVVDLAQGLQAQGHRVEVACACAGPLASELTSSGIPLHVVMKRPVKRRVDLIFAWQLRRVLRQGKFDLVHSHLYASMTAASLAVRGTHLGLVTTVHSENRWQQVGARFVSGLVYRRAGGVIAVSSRIGRLLTEDHRVPPAQIHVIPNALHLSESAPAGVHMACSRRHPLIGVIARLQHEKGVDVFLGAVQQLISRLPDLQSVVIGGGPEARSLQRRASALGLDEHVHFLGPRYRARNFLPSFDLLVVPSRSEGAPLVVLEAMAAGVAVVATNVGDVPNQIRHGVDGLLIPPDRPGDMADAIHALLAAPEWRMKLAREARRRMTFEFRYAATLRQTETVYAAALTGTRPGDETIAAHAGG